MTAAEPSDSQPLPVDFIDLARRGRNGWRYLASIAFIVVVSFIAAAALHLGLPPAWAALTGAPIKFDLNTGQWSGVPPFVTYLELNLTFVALLAALAFAVVRWHRRPLLTLVTPRAAIDWRRVWIGFGLWFVLAGIIAVVEHLLYPGRYQLGANLAGMLLPSLVILVLTPIQTTVEELLFRGYLLQGMALWVRNALVLALINAFVFMLLHLANPEVSAGVILSVMIYWGIGFLLALVTIRSNGLEFALGLHAANNLFTALIANPTVSALPTDSIFVINKLDLTFGLISFIAAGAVFYVVVDRLVARDERAGRSRADAQ